MRPLAVLALLTAAACTRDLTVPPVIDEGSVFGRVVYSAAGYMLPAGSPCIDRGATAPRKDTSVVAKDLDGRARSQGVAPDIGAWERQ